MLTSRDKNNHLKSLSAELLKKRNRQPVLLTHEWATSFPNEAGVFALWEDNGKDPVYVGETANLRSEMARLSRTRDSSLRRHLGHTRFGRYAGFKRAAPSRKFPRLIEERIDTYLLRKVSVAAVPVTLGRKETQERLIEKFGPKFNRNRA